MPLRCAWAVHPSHCLCAGETLPMWKPTTGEPYAGEPHVRFGGRGGATPLPDPYRGKRPRPKLWNWITASIAAAVVLPQVDCWVSSLCYCVGCGKSSLVGRG